MSEGTLSNTESVSPLGKEQSAEIQSFSSQGLLWLGYYSMPPIKSQIQPFYVTTVNTEWLKKATRLEEEKKILIFGSFMSK